MNKRIAYVSNRLRHDTIKERGNSTTTKAKAGAERGDCCGKSERVVVADLSQTLILFKVVSAFHTHHVRRIIKTVKSNRCVR